MKNITEQTSSPHLHINKTICQRCNGCFKDILKHLIKNKNCQNDYDMKTLRERRRQEKLAKKRSDFKLYYKENQDKVNAKSADYYENNRESVHLKQAEYYKNNSQSVLLKQAEYYKNNRESVRLKQGENYRKTIGTRFQYKRFKKHFNKQHAQAYMTPQQEHLFHHTRGVCQPETMPDLNHNIEYSNGSCLLCNEAKAVKIIGVSRIVCLACQKAYCNVCSLEVDADPHHGPLHFSPDTGYLLGMLGHCPLYTEYRQYSDSWDLSPGGYRKKHDNVKDCQICEKVKKDYPEYKLYLEERAPRLKIPGLTAIIPEYYSCNLCYTEKEFACQFDLHMRNHTKYGQSVAILGLLVDVISTKPYMEHVSMEDFAMIEKVLIQTKGVAAVITVFQKSVLEFCGYIPKHEPTKEVNLGAAILVKPGIDIESAISAMLYKEQWNAQLFKVKNYFSETYSAYTTFSDPRRSEISESFLGTYNSRCFHTLMRETNLRRRNVAILENRLDLTVLFSSINVIVLGVH